MKKFIISALLVSLLLLTSCSNEASDTSSVEENLSASISESSETVSEEASEESVETRIPTSFLLAEISSGSTKSVFTYDDNGNLILTVSYNNGAEYRREKQVYDENGFLVEKETGTSDSTKTETFVNTSSGKPLEGTIKTKSGSTNLSTFSYTYNENEQVIRYEQKDADGKVEQLLEYEYLDENGSYRMLEETYLSAVKRVSEHYYDAAGNEIRSFSGNENGEVYSDVSYTYDENDILINETDENGNIVEYKNVYEDGKLVSRKMISQGEILTSISYSYDEYGNLIKQVGKNASGTVFSEITNVWTPIYE